MIIQLTQNDKTYTIDLGSPIDISIALRNDAPDAVTCFYAPPFSFAPHKVGDWVGAVAAGAPVNFMDVRLNPHGNGTHTECVGHIAPEVFSINNALREFHFIAKLTTLYPQKMENGDRIITRAQIAEVLRESEVKALIIRTLPNETDKLTRNYSGTNPPYLSADAAAYIVDCGVEHLLLDLPSVDREEDEGRLAAHHVFWQYPHAPRQHATITELVFVPSEVRDGVYLLNLQIAAFPLDASPSKPVLYRLA